MKRRRGPGRSSSPDGPPIGAADDPAAHVARARVAAILDDLARAELQVVVVGLPDAGRLDARDRARSAAIAAGRGSLLEDATAAARNATMRAFARAGFSGTWAATDMAVSVVRASDRVAAAAALEEAVLAAVVEDLVDDDTLEVLRSTWDELASLRGIPLPGSLTAFASPAASAISSPLQVVIVAGFVVACAVIGFGLGVGAGLIPLALGVAALAALLRRRSQPEV
ncbi:MAG: hypothetical protein ABJC39_12630 [Chloroflexota bacterium]